MRSLLLIAVASILPAIFAIPDANAAPCLTVTLTGTMGGPPEFNGLAGPGTLMRYGDDIDNCNAVRMQFDAGRGTTMRRTLREMCWPASMTRSGAYRSSRSRSSRQA